MDIRKKMPLQARIHIMDENSENSHLKVIPMRLTIREKNTFLKILGTQLLYPLRLIKI